MNRARKNITRKNPTATSAAIVFALLFAGSVAAQDDESSLEHCDHPIGTLAVVEPQDEYAQALSRYSLESPTSLIRMMVQQSNCFVVVERGAAMQNIMQERQLAESGQLQQDSDIGPGQLKAADFVLTPAVLFAEDNAGGVGGAVGGVLGRRRRAVGVLAGGLKFKKAETTLTISDTRTGVQVLASSGEAKKTDFGLGMLGGGLLGGAAVGGYTNTNEGKVIAASFLDNFNNIVTDIRNNPALNDRRADLEGLSGADVASGAVHNAGDVLMPKINNVKVYAAPADNAAVLASLAKEEEVVFLGEESDGFLQVETSVGTGWIKKVLVQ